MACGDILEEERSICSFLAVPHVVKTPREVGVIACFLGVSARAYGGNTTAIRHVEILSCGILDEEDALRPYQTSAECLVGSCKRLLGGFNLRCGLQFVTCFGCLYSVDDTLEGCDRAHSVVTHFLALCGHGKACLIFADELGESLVVGDVGLEAVECSSQGVDVFLGRSVGFNDFLTFQQLCQQVVGHLFIEITQYLLGFVDARFCQSEIEVSVVGGITACGHDLEAQVTVVAKQGQAEQCGAIFLRRVCNVVFAMAHPVCTIF